jgi:hypothetical protein
MSCGITRWQPGQVLYMSVDAGSALRVLEGSVCVVALPIWIGETMFRTTATLHAQQVHVFERGGWIEIVALSAAQVQALPALARQPVIRRWMWGLANRLINKRK